MANAYSIARQYNDYISPVNLGFLNTTLQSLDGKYNANMAKVDALIESTINMPLAREADKKILYQNILNLENEINTFSKMQLTSTDTLRSINNSIQSAITPYIAEQLANSQKLIGFDTKMSKLQEKNPELWNRDNYQYALDNAGVSDYLKGVDKDGKKVDSLKGELIYHDNVDLTKNLTEPLEKFIKEAGLDKYSTVQTSDYVNKIMSGERVTNEKINNFINNKISSDPKLAKQLEINAYSSYRGMDDQEFMQNWKATNSTQRDFYKKAITEIDENLKQADPNSEDFKNLSSQKEFAESKIKDIQDIIDGKSTKSRRQIEFEVYTNGLKNNYANTYAFDRIEKIDYDTTPLKILEFQTNTQLKQAELELKQEANRLKRNELDGLNSQGGIAGTPVDIAPGTAEIAKTTPERVQDTWVNAKDSFANIMAQTDPEFSSLSEQAKVDKLVAVANSLTNLSIDQSPYSAEVTQAALSFLTANNTNIEYRKEINTRWKPVVKTAYQKILEGKNKQLSLTDLQTTMPNVAGFVRQGVKYDDLTVPQQHLILAELSNNMSKYVATNREDKRELETFNFNFRKSLKGKELEAYNKATKLADTKTIADLPGNAWDRLTNTLEGAFDKNISKLDTVLTLVTQGEGAAKRKVFEAFGRELEREKRDTQLVTEASQIIASPFQSDRNVGELQERDLGGDTGFKDWFRQESTRIGTSRTPKDAKFLPTQQETKGMSWNPQDKTQKAITQTWDNLVIAQGKKVAKESTYKAYRDGNDIVLEFLGEKTQMGGTKNDAVKRIVADDKVRIPVNQVPSNIINSLGVEREWSGSFNNQNVKPITMNYNIPKNETERVQRLNNYFSGLGSGLNETQMNTAYSEGFMQTAEEMISPYVSQLKTPEQKQYAENLMNSKYSATISPVAGQGFKAVLNVNGQPTSVNSGIMPSYNMTNFSAQVDRLVKLYITNNIQNVINNNG